MVIHVVHVKEIIILIWNLKEIWTCAMYAMIMITIIVTEQILGLLKGIIGVWATIHKNI